MLRSLSGSKLGIWVAHGEGKFSFPAGMENFAVAARYTYNAYPANPNGSPEGIAGVCSLDGRHLAMMPHPERAVSEMMGGSDGLALFKSILKQWRESHVSHA